MLHERVVGIVGQLAFGDVAGDQHVSGGAIGQFHIRFPVEIRVQIDLDIRQERLRHNPRAIHRHSEKEGRIGDVSKLCKIGRRADRP